MKSKIIQVITAALVLLGSKMGSAAILEADPECCPCSDATFTIDNGGGNITSDCAQQDDCPDGPDGKCTYKEYPATPQAPARKECYCEGFGIGKIACCYLYAAWVGGEWDPDCTGSCNEGYCESGLACTEIHAVDAHGKDLYQCKCQ